VTPHELPPILALAVSGARWPTEDTDEVRVFQSTNKVLAMIDG
jgi:hypothetical protein